MDGNEQAHYGSGCSRIGGGGGTDPFELLSAERACAMLDCNALELDSLRLSNRILAVIDEGGNHVYPDWQFNYDGQPFDRIHDVIAYYGYDHARAYAFMEEAHESLGGRRGYEWMRMSRDHGERPWENAPAGR